MDPQTPDPTDPRPVRPRVFISAKSGDYVPATEVFRHLTAAGIPAFFSEESLPEIGISDYRHQIDRALDAAQHMIVVTSSIEYVQAPWVEAEWGFFINEKRSGRKAGNLVTVLVGGLKPADLPPSLRYYEAIPFDPPGLQRLVRYVAGDAAGDGAAVQPQASAPAVTRKLTLRETATFGGPPASRLLVPVPNERVVATGGFDGAVRVFDIDNRNRRAFFASARYRLARHEGLITARAVSRDGRLVASGHLDGQIHVWRTGADDELSIEMRHDWAISGLAFSPDARVLVSASKDGVLKSWDTARLGKGRPDPVQQREPSPVVALVCMALTDTFAAGLVNATTRGYALHIRPFAAPGDVRAAVPVAGGLAVLAASADGRLLAAGAGDGTVRVYDLSTVRDGSQPAQPLEPVQTLGGHKKPVSSLAFFPDGRHVITCAMENKAIVWELESGQPAVRLQGTGDDIVAAATALDDGETVVAALADGRLRVWESARR